MARPLVSLSEKRADTPEEVRAQTIRGLLGASLGGLGAGAVGGGIWHLIRDYLRGEGTARRAPTLQLSSIRGVSPDVEEEEDEEKLDEAHPVEYSKAAQFGLVQPYTPTSLADVTWEPAAYIAAAGLSAGAGWELVSWLRKRALKVKREQELAAAREEYEAALRDQFGTKEGAVTQYSPLDNLYDAVSVHLMEKSAIDTATGYEAVPGPGLTKDVFTSLKNMLFSPEVSRDYWKYAVITPALLAALGFGYSGYASQRDRSKEKALTEALRRREIELRARKPVPLRAVDVAEEE